MNNGFLSNHEDQLMQALKAGNEQAFTAVFKLFHPGLFYFAQKMINNKEEAEDIVSEKLVALFKRHEQFESLSNVKAFLYLSVRHACLNWLQYKKHHQVVPSTGNS